MNTKVIKVKAGYVAAVCDKYDGIAISFHRSHAAANKAARGRGYAKGNVVNVKEGDEMTVLA